MLVSQSVGVSRQVSWSVCQFGMHVGSQVHWFVKQLG